MKLQQVRLCCCGVSLELGTKIIAWFQIVGSTIFTILAIAGVIDCYSSSIWNILIAETFLGYLSNGLYQIGFGTVLLVGVKMKRPDYINTWVIGSLFGITIYVVELCIELVMGMVSDRERLAEIIVALAIVSAAVVVLEYYCVIVVYSYSKEILALRNPVQLQQV